MANLVTAASEYEKDPKLRKEDIGHLREWLKKQPHLPQSITDEFLISALHSVDYSIEQAKQLVEQNIACRTNFEFFTQRDPLDKKNQATWNCLHFWVSPKVTAENYRIVFASLKDPNPDLFDVFATVRLFATLIDVTVATQGVCPGYVIAVDTRGFSLTHLAKINLSLIRDLLLYVQDSICIKMKAIHITHSSPVIDKLLFIAKPFLKKALLDILHFHTGDHEEFYKAVPRDLLPEEIGGTFGHHQELVDATRAKVESLRDWLIEQEHLRCDESKRVNGHQNPNFMAGSFRKLDLD